VSKFARLKYLKKILDFYIKFMYNKNEPLKARMCRRWCFYFG